jgi:hypothetical protein
MIKEINLKIAELYQELNRLEKAGYSPENLKRVRSIQKQANDLAMARRMRQRQLGLRETA